MGRLETVKSHVAVHPQINTNPPEIAKKIFPFFSLFILFFKICFFLHCSIFRVKKMLLDRDHERGKRHGIGVARLLVIRTILTR